MPSRLCAVGLQIESVARPAAQLRILQFQRNLRRSGLNTSNLCCDVDLFHQSHWLCWASVLFADSLTRPSNSCASCDSIGEMQVDYDESLFLLAGNIHRPRKKDNEQKSIQRGHSICHTTSPALPKCNDESLSLECLQPITGPGDQKKIK